MVEHPASTDVVADVPARNVPAERISRPAYQDSDLSLPQNQRSYTQMAMAGTSWLKDLFGGKTDGQDLTITDGDKAVAGKKLETPGKRPAEGVRPAEDADRKLGLPTVKLEDTGKPLGSGVADAAKVQRKEGYYPTVDRLLGRDGKSEFSHDERVQFKDALKAQHEKEHPGAKHLSVGDELLTGKNRDAVLGNISDKGLRDRIQKRLETGLPDGTEKPAVAPKGKELPAGKEIPTDTTKKRPHDGVEPATDRPTKLEKKQQVIQPGDLSNVPDGPEKNPFLRKYEVGDRFTGLTSTYGSGRETASRMPFNRNDMSAASREFPFGTVLSVTNPANGKEVKIVINDNGPFAKNKVDRPDGGKTYDRVIDLSSRANRELGSPDLARLNYKVLYVPENPQWGDARRNLHGKSYEQLEATVKRFSK